jgi:hypothetical protein
MNYYYLKKQKNLLHVSLITEYVNALTLRCGGGKQELRDTFVN